VRGSIRRSAGRPRWLARPAGRKLHVRDGIDRDTLSQITCPKVIARPAGCFIGGMRTCIGAFPGPAAVARPRPTKPRPSIRLQPYRLDYSARDPSATILAALSCPVGWSITVRRRPLPPRLSCGLAPPASARSYICLVFMPSPPFPAGLRSPYTTPKRGGSAGPLAARVYRGVILLGPRAAWRSTPLTTLSPRKPRITSPRVPGPQTATATPSFAKSSGNGKKRRLENERAGPRGPCLPAGTGFPPN